MSAGAPRWRTVTEYTWWTADGLIALGPEPPEDLSRLIDYQRYRLPDNEAAAAEDAERMKTELFLAGGPDPHGLREKQRAAAAEQRRRVNGVVRGGGLERRRDRAARLDIVREVLRPFRLDEAKWGGWSRKQQGKIVEKVQNELGRRNQRVIVKTIRTDILAILREEKSV